MTEWTAGEDRVHPLREYWVTVKRHRWLILICTLAVLLFAFFYSVTRVPLYTAEATVLIERKAPQNLKVQDTRGDPIANEYNNEFHKTQYEILKSPALAERVIREEGLQNHTLFRDQEDGAIEGLANSAKGWAKGYLPASPATSGPAVVTSPTMRLTGCLSCQAGDSTGRRHELGQGHVHDPRSSAFRPPGQCSCRFLRALWHRPARPDQPGGAGVSAAKTDRAKGASRTSPRTALNSYRKDKESSRSTKRKMSSSTAGWISTKISTKPKPNASVSKRKSGRFAAEVLTRYQPCGRMP